MNISSIKRFLTLPSPVLTSVAFAVGCAGMQGGPPQGPTTSGEDSAALMPAGATLTIANRSSFVFDNIFVSSVDEASWGPDLLGFDLLGPTDHVTVTDIACDTYDIRIVDEDGDECILQSIDFCEDDSTWFIDDAELMACQFN